MDAGIESRSIPSIAYVAERYKKVRLGVCSVMSQVCDVMSQVCGVMSLV